MKIPNLSQRTKRTTILSFSAFFAFNILCLAQGQPPVVQEQEIDYAKNWLYEGGDSEIRHNFKYYSRIDILQAQAKLASINLDSKNGQDKWTGVFEPMPYPELGASKLLISADKGFVKFYVYTCLPELRSLDFGTATVEPSVIWLKSERSNKQNSPQSVLTKYVKVKWGERYLLVAEGDLKEFLIKIAGLEVNSEVLDENAESNWLSVWIKTEAEDSKNTTSDLPLLPYEYADLLRHPIQAKIIMVGKRIISKIKDEYNDEPRYESQTTVKINAGVQQGLKVGMSFRVLNEDEIVKIVEVSRKTSIGIINRELDKKGLETRYDFKSETEKLNPIISVGWQVTTAPDFEVLPWW